MDADLHVRTVHEPHLAAQYELMAELEEEEIIKIRWNKVSCSA